ncbi:MAG TPA: NUDIX hydrolase [Polyangia bacterium]|nr:NUDIX hydrolase [Polyangia bacterium]
MPRDPDLKVVDVADQKILGRGRYVELVEENGWEFVRRHASTGVVVILAVTSEGGLVLVEQPRRPIHGYSIELPAGLVGDVAGSEDESLQIAAERELEEETGYRATRWTKLLEAPSTAGLSSEIITIFRASGLEKVGDGGGDASEEITVHVIPIGEVPAFLAGKLAAGVAVDPKVFAGLYFLDSDWPPAAKDAP